MPSIDERTQALTTSALIPNFTAELQPIAFSRARLFQRARYAIFAQCRCNKALGDFVYFAVCELNGKAYNLDSPLYETSCAEDLADVWRIYANG